MKWRVSCKESTELVSRAMDERLTFAECGLRHPSAKLLGTARPQKLSRLGREKRGGRRGRQENVR